MLRSALVLGVLMVLVSGSGVQAESQAADSVEAAATGYDVSYKDCDAELPSSVGFAIINVNHGRPFTANPCLSDEVAWASGASAGQTEFYLNTSDPGPDRVLNWPAAGVLSPWPCDGAFSRGCAYDFGWAAAQDGFARAADLVGSDGAANTEWWLDVETANSWSDDTALNVVDLQGYVAGLQSVRVRRIGVYATHAHWGEITGATTPTSVINVPFVRLDNWVPRLGTLEQAAGWCQNDQSLSGGRVVYVQYEFFLDKSLACAA